MNAHSTTKELNDLEIDKLFHIYIWTDLYMENIIYIPYLYMDISYILTNTSPLMDWPFFVVASNPQALKPRILNFCNIRL